MALADPAQRPSANEAGKRANPPKCEAFGGDSAERCLPRWGKRTSKEQVIRSPCTKLINSFPALENKLVRPFFLSGLNTSGDLTPQVLGATGASGLPPLAAAVGMVTGVHGVAADRRPNAFPALPAGLAPGH